LEQPSNSRAILVVTAVIAGDGVVLLARKAGGPHRGLWEFPGGKVEAGETPEAVLARELWEEFGITVEVGAFIAASVYAYEHVTVDLRAYAVRYASGALTLTEHDAVRWVPITRLGEYAMPEADVPIARALLECRRRRGA
jgi:8-oxo-dGTP diphosphatase